MIMLTFPGWTTPAMLGKIFLSSLYRTFHQPVLESSSKKKIEIIVVSEIFLKKNTARTLASQVMTGGYQVRSG